MSQHASNIPPNMPQDETRHATDTATDMSPPLRATVEEAANILGTSENAVRKRIERGTLTSEKVDGVRYVLLLNGDIPKHANGTSGGSVGGIPHDITLMQAHLASMQEQVGYLKAVIHTRDEELRRKDHIIAALTERIPELEAPREARESARTASERPYSTHTPSMPETHVSGAQRNRSWWRAFFGLE